MSDTDEQEKQSDLTTLGLSAQEALDKSEQQVHDSVFSRFKDRSVNFWNKELKPPLMTVSVEDVTLVEDNTIELRYIIDETTYTQRFLVPQTREDIESGDYPIIRLLNHVGLDLSNLEKLEYQTVPVIGVTERTVFEKYSPCPFNPDTYKIHLSHSQSLRSKFMYRAIRSLHKARLFHNGKTKLEASSRAYICTILAMICTLFGQQLAFGQVTSISALVIIPITFIIIFMELFLLWARRYQYGIIDKFPSSDNN